MLSNPAGISIPLAWQTTRIPASSSGLMTSGHPRCPLTLQRPDPRYFRSSPSRRQGYPECRRRCRPDRWGMEVARSARAEAGLSPDIPFGAYVPLVVHDDPEEAARIGTFQVSLFARFSAMYGSVVMTRFDGAAGGHAEHPRRLRHAASRTR